MVKTLKKETKIDHHAEIVTKVDSILQTKMTVAHEAGTIDVS